ncbi:MAG: T9SS type A sorting domain-containing protein [Ignavibacteria bacterium]|nr:T9SS type A sorting domain-containing protein [Ignavibacteria bacterium]
MKIDAKGNKWILGNYYLTVGNDSWTYELHLFQLKGDNDYSEIKLPVKDTYGLNIDFENETKWIGVLHYGLVKLTNTNCYLYNHTNDSLLTNVVGIIAVDKKRNKWISATSDWHNMGVSVFNENGVILTSLKNEDNLPSLYSLEQNYPNPFNPFTKISFTIPKFSHVTLKVFDVLGKEISTLVDKGYIAGKYEVEFHGNNLSSGIYFYTLRTDDYKETKKLLLIK